MQACIYGDGLLKEVEQSEISEQGIKGNIVFRQNRDASLFPCTTVGPLYDS